LYKKHRRKYRLASTYADRAMVSHPFPGEHLALLVNLRSVALDPELSVLTDRAVGTLSSFEWVRCAAHIQRTPETALKPAENT